MHLLALDVGTRRTGIAFCDDQTQVPVSLPTLTHSSLDELATHVLSLCKDRNVPRVIVGLPFLPGGSEGSQCAVSREVGAQLSNQGIEVEFVDERYSTVNQKDVDGDAAAACQILLSYVDRKQSGQ